MKDFVTKVVVFNLVAALSISPDLRCDAVSIDSNTDQVSAIGTTQETDLDPDIKEFVSKIYSNLSMVDDADKISELDELKEQFVVCKTRPKKRLLANKALRIIKKLASSIEIRKNKELRFGFVLFLQKQLLFFGFNQECITNFVHQLKWEGKFNLAMLKTKLFFEKTDIIRADLFAIIETLVFLAKSALVLEEYWKGGDAPVLGRRLIVSTVVDFLGIAAFLRASRNKLEQPENSSGTPVDTNT